MLPILRIIPVGGVFLAIMILVLSLSPPGGPRTGMRAVNLAARGPLMQKDEHPEWRQLLILAAIQRADEISRLRNLPDTPLRNDSAQDSNQQDSNQNDTDKSDLNDNAGKVAGLPLDRSSADPDDETGSINETPGATIPIDIGETSSTELPMKTPEEAPPVIRSPERARQPHESHRKPVRRVRQRVQTARIEPTPPFNLFEVLFGLDRRQASSAPIVQPGAGRRSDLR